MNSSKIILNNFLYNSGIVGFYKILKEANKENLVQVDGNCIYVKNEALENFEEDYFNTIINTFEEDTKWYAITNSEEKLIQLNEEEQKQELEHLTKRIKDAMESASYKSGYEIIKDKTEENPYELLKQLKKSTDMNEQKEILLKIIKHLKDNKEIYCMKDIIYTKVNCFWSNVAFLNRSANKKDMKEEYKKVFVMPAQKYVKSKQEGTYQCVECGQAIEKQEASGMSFLNDVGVDINRKKSGFWNFKEDMLICPICNLIYSCVPLGFTMIGSNGIFINSNRSLTNLLQENELIKIEKLTEENTLEKVYNKIITYYINQMDKMTLEKRTKYEPRNIQVIKRVGQKDNQHYEFNIISKDKLEVIKRASNDLKKVSKSSVYNDVVKNVIQNIKQYILISKLLREKDYRHIKEILKIEAATMEGGINLKTRKECIEDMIHEGELLQIYFYKNNENKNKLESYGFKLQNALKVNSVEEFMKLFTLFYGSLNKAMPNGEAMKRLIEDPEDFRLLGYAYIYGLGKVIDKKGGNEDEE
jgi:CRISPR-associated protein Cst1